MSQHLSLSVLLLYLEGAEIPIKNQEGQVGKNCGFAGTSGAVKTGIYLCAIGGKFRGSRSILGLHGRKKNSKRGPKRTRPQSS